MRVFENEKMEVGVNETHVIVYYNDEIKVIDRKTCKEVNNDSLLRNLMDEAESIDVAESFEVMPQDVTTLLRKLYSKGDE